MRKKLVLNFSGKEIIINSFLKGGNIKTVEESTTSNYIKLMNFETNETRRNNDEML